MLRAAAVPPRPRCVKMLLPRAPLSTRRVGRTRAFDRDTARRVPPPPGPPPLTDAPPPPPPPPPLTNDASFFSSGGRWVVGGALALVAWWASIALQAPVLRSGLDGYEYVTTAGGATVLFAQDEAGRTFLVDGAGDLYYDSGDDAIGWYIVDPRGTVFNLYFDNGAPARRRVGTMDDLRTVDAAALAGIPVDELRAAGVAAGGRITGFLSDDGIPLPPNAPLGTSPDGTPVGPPVLEEDVILVGKKGLSGGARKGDALDALAGAATKARAAAEGKRG